MIFIAIIILIIVSGIEIDICVPAFPQMQTYFNLTPFKTEAILGVNIFFHCIAAFFAGTLGDKYGKKFIINIGIFIFIIGTYLCMIANSYTILLVCRAIQGIGVAMPMVLGQLIMMDSYKKSEHQIKSTIFNGFVTLGVCTGPVIGSYATFFFGWRSNFLFLLIFSIFAIILFNIFVPKDDKINKNIKFSISAYYPIFKSPIVILCILVFSLETGSYYAFVGLAPLIYIDSFGVNMWHFGIYQAFLTFVFGIFSIFCGQIIKFIGKKVAFITSITLFILFIPICFVLILLNSKSPILITFAMSILSIGVVIPLNFIYIYGLNLIPNTGSRVSAIMVVGKWAISILSFQTAAFFYTNDFRSTGIVIFIMELFSIILTLYLFKKDPNFRKEVYQ